MGIYDREYYREERVGMGFRPPMAVVAALVIANIAVLLADFLFTPDVRQGGRTLLQDYLGMTPQTLYRPWQWYRFLTYGFVHDQRLFHLIGNMLILYFFGNDVEQRLGRNEFLRFYLLCLLTGSIVWALLGAGGVAENPNVRMFGASGAAVGVLVLFAFYYPRRTVFAYFIIPMPAWLLGAIIVGADLFGALGGGAAPVAYSVHLAGAATAFLYAQLRWNLGRPFEWIADWWRKRGRPKLRVVRPQPLEHDEDDPTSTEEEVDRILAKLSAQGLDGLTADERRTLQDASRRYQQKLRAGRNGGDAS